MAVVCLTQGDAIGILHLALALASPTLSAHIASSNVTCASWTLGKVTDQMGTDMQQAEHLHTACVQGRERAATARKVQQPSQLTGLRANRSLADRRLTTSR